MKFVRSAFSHYLPRLHRALYQADAVVLWTMPMANRAAGWLDDRFHAAFREMMLHAAMREGLLCPAYCLMPDHVHLVWMGLRPESDQRNAMKFLRAHLSRHLRGCAFQHQAHDRVFRRSERHSTGIAAGCSEYVLLNPVRGGLVSESKAWPYLGAIVPGYPSLNPMDPGYWEWFWERYHSVLDPKVLDRVVPPRSME